MKLNCGPGPQERARLKQAQEEANQDYYLNWHRVFLWFPLRLSETECRWLEFVERRYGYYNKRYGFKCLSEYRKIRKL